MLTSSINRNKPHFKSLCVGCFVAIAYQYITWQYHDSNTLTEGIAWLSLQTSVMLMVLPLYVIVFLQWSRQKYSWKWVVGLSSVSVVFFIINLSSDYSLRFSGDVSLVKYTLFSGEEASRLIGERSVYIKLLQVYAVAVLAVLIWIAARLVKQKQYVLSVILITTLCIQIGVAVTTIFIDSGMFNFIYMGGLPATILNFVACVTVAMSLELKTKTLKNQVRIRQNLESVLASLAQDGGQKDSHEFFVNSMQQLQHLSKADMAYLCLHSEEDGVEIITTTVVFLNDKQITNFAYELASVPEALVSFEELIFIEKDVASTYPDIELFQTVKAQSFINAPMLNDDGNLEGSIVLLWTQPLRKHRTYFQTLEIFRSRMAAELKRNRLEKQMHQMAYYDYQTGLPNLIKLHEIINTCYDQDVQKNTQSALLVLDLKRFTEVNRQYGFENAERAIKELGERLKNYANADIVTGRIGGNKFAMLLKNASHNVEGLLNLHWEALLGLIKAPIEVGSRTISLDCNAGAVIFPLLLEVNIETVRCAEIALSQAKQDTQSSMRLFDVSILEEIDRKAKVEKLLQRALECNSEMFAVYQPKVNATGVLIGAEALARWINKDLGFVSPDEFISVAEKAGLIGKLGLWMVETVCKQINEWKAEGFNMPGRIAINVSALQLSDDNFVNALTCLVDEYDVHPSQLEIELTESGLLTNLGKSISRLQQLREAGFTIALDDFGTGYSSLSYLKDLPLDVLKIDRSFVNSLDAKNAAELARSIIAIGQHMSMGIVAEGVEELAQVTALNSMGCNIFQGYYFAKPMKADDFLVWAATKFVDLNISVKTPTSTKANT